MKYDDHIRNTSDVQFYVAFICYFCVNSTIITAKNIFSPFSTLDTNMAEDAFHNR